VENPSLSPFRKGRAIISPLEKGGSRGILATIDTTFGRLLYSSFMNLKVWFLETRPQFLILPVVLAFLGTSMAWYDGAFHLGRAILAFVGLLLCHISVNVLNDYYDYKSGVDLRTKRTPFSGGSGMLPTGSLTPRQVFWFGMTCFILAIPIGIYFVVTTGWLLLPLLIIGAVCILLYTPFFTKLGWPEWAPGIGLGTLPVLGAYFVQTGQYTIPALVAAIPSGILVHNLLLLNEFPDTEADKTGARKTLPITMGGKGASLVYSILAGLIYLWTIVAVVLKLMPVFTLIALLTLPFAITAIRGALGYGDKSRLMPGMANNVLLTLVFQLLLGVGYVLARIF
jgi:1,4-dihydroxy-2-naphthoate octaprenyltransferase